MPSDAADRAAARLSPLSLGAHTVFDILNSGGLLMLPILLCSVIAIAIVIERAWTLSTARVMPKYALAQVWTWIKNG